MAIEGFGNLARELNKFSERIDEYAERHGARPSEVEKKIDEAIVLALNEAIVPEAKRRAPVDTGALADSITYERMRRSPPVYQFGPDSSELPGDGEYARVQEYGTTKKEYPIEPRGDYPLSFYWEKKGKHVAFEYVVHPGVEGKHYIRDALENNIHEVEGYVGLKMREIVEEISD